MLWLVFAMLLIMCLVAAFTSYEILGGLVQGALIIGLVALGIHRLRRYRVD